MPKLKVNVFSFSTEDPIHIANNILLNDTHKKWKCHSAGEKSANVILQLDTPSKISGIDIGNEHSAYIEVLVSRSSNPNEDFKVLLVMSSFMSPLESRQSTNINKVRMFSYQELQSPERDHKWDRVKIVCTQPFNRHVQYGLSFVTLHKSDKDDSGDTPGKLGNFLIRPKSPDNLSVGSLFARRKELTNNSPQSAAAAIREASASYNLSQCKPKLKDGTVAKKGSTVVIKKDTPIDSNSDTDNKSKSRYRDELLYSAEEEKPNEKIDKLVEQKIREGREKLLKEEEEAKKAKASKRTDTNRLDLPSTSTGTSSSNSSNNAKDSNKRKSNVKDTPQKKMKVDKKQYKPFNKLLNGVTIVISGIQNPDRGTIRSNALAMGAKYKSDWDDSCTHLICAYTNTPKFNQVKGRGKIVNRNWVTACYSNRKRLPWRRYALDKQDKNKDESEEETWEEKEKSPDIEMIYNWDEDDVDTEDEIEKIESLQKTKKKAVLSGYFAETDEEENINVKSIDKIPELPQFLSNKVLYIDKELSDSTKSLLFRYITAYKGILVDEPSDVVDYAIASPKTSDMLNVICPVAHVVSPDWIWECHNLKTIVPIDRYKL